MNDGTHQLPESSRNALIRMAEKLRAGFTGKLEIDCNQGGVRQLREIVTVPSEKLKDEAA